MGAENQDLTPCGLLRPARRSHRLRHHAYRIPPRGRHWMSRRGSGVLVRAGANAGPVRSSRRRALRCPAISRHRPGRDRRSHPRSPDRSEESGVLYVGAATGGIWKSTNNGVTWKDVFGSQPDNTFGALAIFAGDSKIVWAGTGEQNNRQSSSWGGGVYRSTDGGDDVDATSACTRRASIGRVVLDPDEPEHRVRRRRRKSLGRQSGARRLQDDRRRPHVDEGALRRHVHRRDRPRDGSARSERALRGDVSASAQRVRLQRRRTGQRDLQDDRRRRHLEEARERHSGRRQGTHRSRDRALEARRAHRDHRARDGRRHLSHRRRRRDVEADERAPIRGRCTTASRRSIPTTTSASGCPAPTSSRARTAARRSRKSRRRRPTTSA